MLLHLASAVYPLICAAISVTAPSQIREFGRLWHGSKQIRLLSVSSQNKPGVFDIDALGSQCQ
jgi:hypothetical protein